MSIRLPSTPSMGDIAKAIRDMDRIVDELRNNFLVGARKERGDVDMSGNRLSGLRDASRDDDAVPRKQVNRDFAPKTAQYLVHASDGTLTNERVLTAGTGITLTPSTGVLTIATSGAGTGDLKADGTVPLTADWDAGAFEIRAQTFESDVATGTAPLTVASTTVVTNLNADLLDGNHASAFLTSADIGVNVQAYHSNLTTWAGKTAPTGTVIGTLDSQTMSNKSLDDSSTSFIDDGDSTKKMRFQCIGITTGTTRTLTVPNASGTIALTSDLASYLTTAAAAAAYQPLDADLTSWAGVTRAAGFDTFAATPTSANFATLIGGDLAVADGGTGRSTGTTAYALIATGTTATGAQQTLAAGATTEILVGGGASALPVWTTATGSGAPVRATSPTLVAPVLGAATGTSLFLGGTPATGVLSYVNTDANLATASALLPLSQVRNILNPAASSASIDYCYYATLRSDSSCAQDFTAARAAYRSACEHLGSGTMEGLQGAHFWASSGPNSGASSGSGIVNNLYGVLADAWVNSTSSGTTTRVAAAQFSARNLSPGTVTTLISNNVAVGSADGGSGAGTITQAYGLRVSGLDVTGADILTAGTITNGTMLEVGDWTSGPTYTNPPIGINVASQTASGAFALKTGTGKVSLGDKITTYNAIATVGNGVPSIVAQASGTAQSAAVAATTLLTPGADGAYRITVQLKVTTPATSSSTLGAVTLTYTDGNDSVAQTVTMGLVNNSAAFASTATGNSTGSRLNGASFIYAKSGVAIQYAIGYASSGATAMQYAYNIKVEAL